MDPINGFPSGQNQAQGQAHDQPSQSPHSPLNQRLPNFNNSPFSLDFLVNANGPQFQTSHSHSPLSPGIPAGSPSYSPSSAAGHSPVVSTPYGPHYQVQANHPSDGFPSLFPPFAIPSTNNNLHNLANLQNTQNIQVIPGVQGIGANSAAGASQWGQLPVAQSQVQTQGHGHQGQGQQLPYPVNNPLYHPHSQPNPPQPQLPSHSQHPQPQPIGPFSNVQNSQAISNNFNDFNGSNINTAIHNAVNISAGHTGPIGNVEEQSNCSQTPGLVPTAIDTFDFNGLGFEGDVPVRVDGHNDHRRSLDSIHNQDIFDVRDQVPSHLHPHSLPQQHQQSDLPLSLSLSPEAMKRVEQWSHNLEKQQVVANILSDWERTMTEQATSGATGSNFSDPKLPSNDDLLQLTRPHHNNAGNVDEDGDNVGTSKGKRNANTTGNGKKTGKGSRGKPIGYICIWPNCEEARTNKSLRSDRASEHVRAHLGMIPYRCHKGAMDFLRKADRDRHSKACKGGCAPRTSSVQVLHAHAHTHPPTPVRPYSRLPSHAVGTSSVNRSMVMSPSGMQSSSSNFAYRPFASTSNHSLNSTSSHSPIVSPVTVQSHQYPSQHRKAKRPRNLRGVSVDGSGSEEVSSGYGSAPTSATATAPPSGPTTIPSASAPAAMTSFYPGHGHGGRSASANTSPVAHRRPLVHHKATLSGLSAISASSGNGEYDYDYTHNGHTQSQNAYTTGHHFNTTLNTFTNATPTFDSPVTISPHRNSLQTFGSPFGGSLQLSMTSQDASQSSQSQSQPNMPYGSDPHSYSHSRH